MESNRVSSRGYGWYRMVPSLLANEDIYSPKNKIKGERDHLEEQNRHYRIGRYDSDHSTLLECCYGMVSELYRHALCVGLSPYFSILGFVQPGQGCFKGDDVV